MKGERIVIPRSMRSSVLELVHAGHIPANHVYMGPIWAESGHLSHLGPA